MQQNNTNFYAYFEVLFQMMIDPFLRLMC